jgi:hypothetical protein
MCLLVVEAILQITSGFQVWVSVFMSLQGVTVISRQNYLGLQLLGPLTNACHALLIAKSRGLGIPIGHFYLDLKFSGNVLSISLF